MKILKRTLSILLAVCILASAAVVASAVEKTDYRTGEIKYYQRDESGKVVNDGSGNPIEKTAEKMYGTRPVVSEVVNSDPEIQVKTRKYRFYMPDEWRNDRNDNYDGNSLDSCCPCVYWWSTSYNSDNYMGNSTKGWPGFRILEQDPDDPHIFVCDIPEDAVKIIFNNSVDGGQTPVDNPNYGYNYQTYDIPTSYTDPEDDDYRFYTTTKDGQAISPENPMTFEDMIYVIDPNNTTISDLSEAPMVHGDWFYYYGNGKYGITPEQGDEVLANGDFISSLQISDTNIVSYLNKEPSYTIYCSAEAANLEVKSENESVATVSAVSACKGYGFWRSEVTITGVAEGETNIIFEETYPDSDFKAKRTCKVEVIDWNRPTSYTPEGNNIYFDAKGWKSFNKIYCHIWEIGGNSFFGWQTPFEECTRVKGTTYSYDLSKLTNSMDVPGGMKSGGKYGVIFSANTGVQSYDLTIGTECIGDIACLTGKKIENPVDSNKRGDEVVWTNNSDKYGPHLTLTSIGNVIGSHLAPGETGIQVIGNWTPTFFNSPNVDAVEALANAYPKFGITTIEDINNIYAYILTKDVNKRDLSKIKKTLEDAFYKAYPNQQSSTNPTNPVQPDIIDISNWKVSGIKNLTYTGKVLKQKNIIVSNNNEYADFTTRYKNNLNVGTATVIITGTSVYTGTITKTFKILKANNPMTVKAAAKTVKYKAVKKKAQTFSVITVKKAVGAVSYKKTSGKSFFTVNVKTGKVTVKKGTKKGTYTVKVKVSAKGNSNYNTVSKTVRVKIKVK